MPENRSPIPQRDLAAENAPLRAEIDAAVRRVLDSQQFVLGPEVEAFEREFADYCGVAHAIGCASGSDAVLLALMAIGVSPGDQVICPSYTFFATASGVTRLGATPVFADVDPTTLNLCPEAARKAAARCTRLRAILPVDLFGRMADGPAFAALGTELGVPILADAAQAVGARDAGGRRAGSFGDIACFSLYPTKNLGALGDAGALLTDDAALADRLQLLHVHGTRESYRHELLGINSRLDAVQAAVLRVKLPHLDDWNADRRRIAATYDGAFAAAGAGVGARGAALEALPLALGTPPPADGEPACHQYPVRVPAAHRDALQTRLAEDGIGTRVYYPLGVHQQPCYASQGTAIAELPETESAASENLCLPIYPGLEADAIERVVDAVATHLAALRD